MALGPALSNQFERQVGPEPVDLGDIAAEQSVQCGADVEGHGIGLLLGCPDGRWFACRRRRGLPQPRQDRLNAHIAERHLGVVDVIQLQRLGQRKDVLLAVIADQRLTDCLRGGVAASVAMGGEHRRVALPGHEGADDGHAGRPCYVRHHVMELQVHLRQSFLHVLDVRARIVQQPFTLTQVAPQDGNLALQPETGPEQPILMQPLQPLGITDVGLASRHVLGVAGIDQDDLEAALVEDLEGRDGSVKNLGRYAASGIAWWPKRPSSTAALT